MTNFESALQNLNPGQLKAVQAIEGPVLVVAGPGTGKTQVLAMRIANILKTTDAKPGNILCLTFTEAAVQAMRQRLIRIIGNSAHQVKITTFHGFCNEVIQSFPDKFAFAKDLSQLTDLDKVKLMREMLEGLDVEVKYMLRPFFDKYKYQRDILSAIQTLKREGVNPQKLQQIAEANLTELNSQPKLNKKTGKPTQEWSRNVQQAERQIELSNLYAKYQELILERGLYDYEDMILFVIEKFNQDDELLAHYQEMYLYILVDEYQDTNGAQNEIIQLLGSFDSAPNIFVVGDDDQAIYRFQGANVGNLLEFKANFPEMQTVEIVDNYRSSQIILDAAESVISHNHARLVNHIPELSKHLQSRLEIPDHALDVYNFHTRDAENKFVIESVNQLLANGVQPNEVAILYRRHSDAEDIAIDLLKAGLPIRMAIGQNALDEIKIIQLVNLLKLIQFEVAERDRLLAQVIFYDFLHINRLEAFKAVRFCGDRHISLIDLCMKPELQLEIELGEGSQLLAFLHKVISWRQDAHNKLVIELLEIVMRDSGLMAELLQPDIDGDDRNARVEDLNAVNSFFSYVRLLNMANRELTLSDLLSDLHLLRDNGLVINQQQLDINRQGVQLMTAHAAKGLEFKYVFIIKCHDGNWGSGGRSQGIKLPEEIYFDEELGANERDSEIKFDSDIDHDVEDERRLFYVALTRAREKIFITTAKVYPSANGNKEVTISRFINEIDPRCVRMCDTAEYEQLDEVAISRALSPMLLRPYAEAEREYLKCLVEDFVLSPSALNDYIECPLKFKFDRLLLVPRLQTKTQVLGTAIHFALERLMRNLQKGNTLSLAEVTTAFDTAVKRELLNPQDQQDTLTEGHYILEKYYQNYQSEFQAPAEIEYHFAARNLMLTHDQGEPICITGTLDRVDWLSKADGEVKIVDYKTMAPKSVNEIMGKTKNSTGSIYRQLIFYKLLTDLDDRFRPGINKSKYKVTAIEIDFLKPDTSHNFKKVQFDVGSEEVDELKQEIITVMQHIRNLDFAGTEDYPLCGECEYCQMLNNIK